MTRRILGAAPIAGIGAFQPWAPAPPAHPAVQEDYLPKAAHLEVRMKWLTSLFLVAALAEPLAAQDSVPPKSKP